MMVTGARASSDSAMTTVTRLVPRSRPTVFFRRDKTVLKRLLERMGYRRAGCGDYIGSGSFAGPDFVCQARLPSRACGQTVLGQAASALLMRAMSGSRNLAISPYLNSPWM